MSRQVKINTMNSSLNRKTLIAVFIAVPVMIMIYALIVGLVIPNLNSTEFYYPFIIIWMIGSILIFKLIYNFVNPRDNFGFITGKEKRGRKNHEKLMNQEVKTFYLKDYLKQDKE